MTHRLHRPAWGKLAAIGLVTIPLQTGCGDESLPAREPSTAEPLHMFSTALPDDLSDQALAALERDAYRREHRFWDAAEPGYLFSKTRVAEHDIEAGDSYSSEDLFQIGGQLFTFTFTKAQGLGGQDSPSIRRIHKGRRGGPDTYKCASCHWRGGPAGAGDGADNAYLDGDGDTQSSAFARNPISLAGSGYVEILATEMTAELAKIRASLLEEAAAQGSPARGELVAKGISFGHLTAGPDGALDTAEVSGVSDDLVVRPFGHKGSFATVRDAVEDALLVHHGMESTHLVKTAPVTRKGPFGGDDPDGDGVKDEITEGQVTALTLYTAMQEVPVINLPTFENLALMWADGKARFNQIGCGSCHVPSLPISGTVLTLPSREGGRPVSIDLAIAGAEPRLTPTEDGEHRLFLYSDLKRHDMGPLLAEARADRGVPGNLFITRPLWGVARSRPYLHDGRAVRLEDAILLHGGEAEASKQAFEALSELERAPVRVFLTSLTRAKRMITQ